MRICVYGAGAMGGAIAGRLARAGHEVSVVARGAHGRAIAERGLTLIEPDGSRWTTRPRVSERPAELGRQDAVIVALKSNLFSDAAESMVPLLGPETLVVTAMNGVPYWYFHRHGGPHDGKRLASVDPGDRCWRLLGPERAIGTVLWMAGSVAEPGAIACGPGLGLPVGEPDGSRSTRVSALAEALLSAGFEAPIKDRIRDELWLKLWGNLSLNPITALTLGTLGASAGDEDAAWVAARMMEEARAIGQALGVAFPTSIPERLAMAAKLIGHKTSMHQDLERGRRLELGAIVAAVVEMGALAGIATPTVETVLRLARARARTAGLD
ncbi:MAG: 2-dehydropantoate 2-reductase [Alphaproteobacteria bacterium]|nr:2-dehydropantoate 2-reductase [Alphaproteobacteria bacterium]